MTGELLLLDATTEEEGGPVGRVLQRRFQICDPACEFGDTLDAVLNELKRHADHQQINMDLSSKILMTSNIFVGKQDLCVF